MEREQPDERKRDNDMEILKRLKVKSAPGFWKNLGPTTFPEAVACTLWVGKDCEGREIYTMTTDREGVAIEPSGTRYHSTQAAAIKAGRISVAEERAVKAGARVDPKDNWRDY